MNATAPPSARIAQARQRLEEQEAAAISEERNEARREAIAERQALIQRQTEELPPLQAAVDVSHDELKAVEKVLLEKKIALQAAQSRKSSAAWELSRALDRCVFRLEHTLCDERITDVIAELEQTASAIQHVGGERTPEQYAAAVAWLEWKREAGRPGLMELCMADNSGLDAAIAKVLSGAPRI